MNSPVGISVANVVSSATRTTKYWTLKFIHMSDQKLYNYNLYIFDHLYNIIIMFLYVIVYIIIVTTK